MNLVWIAEHAHFHGPAAPSFVALRSRLSSVLHRTWAFLEQAGMARARAQMLRESISIEASQPELARELRQAADRMRT